MWSAGTGADHDDVVVFGSQTDPAGDGAAHRAEDVLSDAV
jgi:hypothetical protein